MTNKEMLRRLEDAFVRENVTYDYDGEVYKIGTVELSYPCYEKLIKDLEKDALREEVLKPMRKNYLKYYGMSTYGKYGSVITGGYHINALADMDIKDRIKMLDVHELYPSVALFSKTATFKVDDYFTKHYIINDGKIITKKAVVLGPSKTNGRNIESVTVDEYCANDVKFMERIISKDVKPKVMFNGPATIFQYGGFKTVVKCDPKDSFDALTGLGIALYRYYRQHKDYKKQYQTLSYFMDLDELVRYALYQFCGWNVSKIRNLEKKLKKFDDGTWITLDI